MLSRLGEDGAPAPLVLCQTAKEERSCWNPGAFNSSLVRRALFIVEKFIGGRNTQLV